MIDDKLLVSDKSSYFLISPLFLLRKVIKERNEPTKRLWAIFLNLKFWQNLALTAKRSLWTPSVNGNWSNYLSLFGFFLNVFCPLKRKQLLEENNTFYIPSIFLDPFVCSYFSFFVLEFWYVWLIGILERFQICSPFFAPVPLFKDSIYS